MAHGSILVVHLSAVLLGAQVTRIAVVISGNVAPGAQVASLTVYNNGVAAVEDS